jgi:hypothetical protein
MQCSNTRCVMQVPEEESRRDRAQTKFRISRATLPASASRHFGDNAEGLEFAEIG